MGFSYQNSLSFRPFWGSGGETGVDNSEVRKDITPYGGRIHDSGGMFVHSEKFVGSCGGKLGDISIYWQESTVPASRLSVRNLALRGFEANFSPDHAASFNIKPWNALPDNRTLRLQIGVFRRHCWMFSRGLASLAFSPFIITHRHGGGS